MTDQPVEVWRCPTCGTPMLGEDGDYRCPIANCPSNLRDRRALLRDVDGPVTCVNCGLPIEQIGRWGNGERKHQHANGMEFCNPSDIAANAVRQPSPNASSSSSGGVGRETDG